MESAIPPNFFANRLGLNDPACGIYAVDDAGGIRFEYTVPEAALMGGGELPLSSMLAIADDVTTWAAVGADRYSRPGVSVELSLTRSRARPVRAGDRIVVSPLVTKLGRAMAFLRATVSDAETGDLVATCRHTKYVHMGAGWDLLFGPGSAVAKVLLPLVGRRAAAEAGGASAAQPLVSLGSSVRALGDGSSTGVASFACDAGHFNLPAEFGGGMHGGCQAVVHELAAAEAAEAAAEAAAETRRGRLALQEMSVSYLSSGKVGEKCVVVHAPGLGGGGGAVAPASLAAPAWAARSSAADGSDGRSVLCSSRLLNGAELDAPCVSEATLRFSRVL